MRCLILSRSVIASRSVPAIPQTARQLGTACRVLDVPVPEIVLQRSGIAPMVGELVTTAMPQLIRMDEPMEPEPPRRSAPVFCGRRLPSSGLCAPLDDTVPSRGSRRSRRSAQLFARERMDRQTLTRGCRQMMERNEDRYRFAETAPCSTQTRQPLSIGVGRPFLTFQYQAAPGCGVPADRVA
jgi:hypothetical protein